MTSQRRLLYRKHPHIANMVKRLPASKISIPKQVSTSVQSVALGERKSAKDNQAWKYTGNVIQRMPDVKINGISYFDPKELPAEMPRRKHESNFFITINTNKQPPTNNLALGNDALTAALEHLSRDEILAKYLTFGPKDDRYFEDRYCDVIQKVDWQAGCELGDKLCRLHAHVWLTVNHCSQIQINRTLLGEEFKEIYNMRAPASMKCNGKPYVSVKLLPESNFAEIMKNYMRKAAR